jgi:hypothetical protein
MAMSDVNYSENNWLAFVLEHEEDHYDTPVAYRFSSEREFLETSSPLGGESTWQGDGVKWGGDDVTWQGE